MTIEDQRHEMLAALPGRAERKALLVELWCHGILSEEQVAFWFYVFDLHDA